MQLEEFVGSGHKFMKRISYKCYTLQFQKKLREYMALSRRTCYQTLMMEDITDIINNLLTVYPKITHVEIGIKNLYSKTFHS
jgi:hypothetical protein